MRRLTIAMSLLVAAVVFPAAVFSQRAYEPKFWVGADGGMTFSNMQFSPSVKQSMLGGKTLAFRMRYAEEKYFGLIGELILEQRGWKEDFKEDKDKFNYSRTLTYLTLP
ncbi:MAG: PorT family protein, partial [Paramuribaculum sp.]|nr:PorT family protein [Paramuribaculum sp.]